MSNEDATSYQSWWTRFKSKLTITLLVILQCFAYQQVQLIFRNIYYLTMVFRFGSLRLQLPTWCNWAYLKRTYLSRQHPMILYQMLSLPDRHSQTLMVGENYWLLPMSFTFIEPKQYLTGFFLYLLLKVIQLQTMNCSIFPVIMLVYPMRQWKLVDHMKSEENVMSWRISQSSIQL